MTPTEYVLKRIEEQQTDIITSMADGICKDYAEYRRLVGKLEGLTFAKNQLLYAQRKTQESDDD